MADVDLAIVGGGVAGLTAGLYAAWHRLDAVLLERMGTGGQIINADRVENYPGFPGGIKGYELAPLVAQQAMELGLRVEFADARRVTHDGNGYTVETDGEAWHARAVIVAAGSTLAKLDVPGEAEFEGRGVSYCAVCDGEFFRDKPVAVVGSGDSALDEALVLAEVASEVTVLHRQDKVHAAAALVERAHAHPRIRFRPNTEVRAIEGDEAVERLLLRGQDGRAAHLPASGVFIYVGLRPNSSLLDGLLPVDAGGHIPVDLWMRAPLPGLLAAGDIRQHSARQVVSAAGDGATAAMAAMRYLRRGEWGAAE